MSSALATSRHALTPFRITATRFDLSSLFLCMFDCSSLPRIGLPFFSNIHRFGLHFNSSILKPTYSRSNFLCPNNSLPHLNSRFCLRTARHILALLQFSSTSNTQEETPLKLSHMYCVLNNFNSNGLARVLTCCIFLGFFLMTHTTMLYSTGHNGAVDEEVMLEEQRFVQLSATACCRMSLGSSCAAGRQILRRRRRPTPQSPRAHTRRSDRFSLRQPLSRGMRPGSSDVELGGGSLVRLDSYNGEDEIRWLGDNSIQSLDASIRQCRA